MKRSLWWCKVRYRIGCPGLLVNLRSEPGCRCLGFYGNIDDAEGTMHIIRVFIL